MYRDSSGRTLEDYPRPSVAVDTAVLTVDRVDGRLEVLQHHRDDDGEWALPGTFLHRGETLEQAVRRSLAAKVGLAEGALRGVHIQQLRVFDEPARDPRGWVLSVAHLAVVPRSRLEPVLADGRVRLQPVDDVRGLTFVDHPAIVRAAVDHVRRQYAVRPDPARLLGDDFSIKELYDLHAAVAGPVDPGTQRPSIDTFRRYMTQGGLITRTEGTTEGRGVMGAPAQLYRRAGDVASEIALVGVRPTRPTRTPSRWLAPSPEEWGLLLDKHSVRPALRTLLAKLAARTRLVATDRPSYVTLHPAEDRPVAAYVHAHRISIVLDPADARTFGAEDAAVRVEQVSARSWHVHVPDAALGEKATRRRARSYLHRALDRSAAGTAKGSGGSGAGGRARAGWDPR
ncbi:NUDIX domain-containing protein [Geodermatophilus normandii]|uniref:NUDIX domain-containing protein n=1 Tax=Geodermatophilus normandii TaxID=1137989 RepID=A0A317QKU1_9ACTN|nr:NUDIX domain-containing protein [Geodermatophilus normandii]